MSENFVSQVWTLMLFSINWNVFHLLWLCMWFLGNTWYSSIRDHKACSFLSPFISRGGVTDERPTIGKPRYSTGFFYFASREYFSLPNRFVLLPFLILLLWYWWNPHSPLLRSLSRTREETSVLPPPLNATIVPVPQLWTLRTMMITATPEST